MTIRSKAPLRLGLAGGGSDVSPYSDLFGGAVLNATINLSAYCTIEECVDRTVSIDSFDSGYHGSYPLSEGPAPLDIDGNASLVKGVFNHVLNSVLESGRRDAAETLSRGFRITTWNDAMAGSGLGTSSTMVVCILDCFSKWLGLPMDAMSLARQAYRIERVDLKLAGGKQDQYSAAFGGFNFMEFSRDGGVTVQPLHLEDWVRSELETSLVLYYTGRSRSSAAIIEEQQRNTSSGNESALEAMHRIRRSAYEMRDAVMGGDMKGLARIVGQAWEEKKKMAGAISNSVIQNALDVGLSHGAVAGKVSGAGGGGVIMFIVDPTRRVEVIDSLDALDGKVIPFQFSPRGAHSWIAGKP